MDTQIYDDIQYKINNKNYYNNILINNRIKELKKYIDEVPNFKIFDNKDINNSCSICLDEFEHNIDDKSIISQFIDEYNKNIIHNLNIMVLSCGHYFHTHCIYNFNTSKLIYSNCPICRDKSVNIIPNVANEFSLYNIITHQKLINKYTDNIIINYDDISHYITKYINHSIELECMKLFQHEIFNKNNKNNNHILNNDNNILYYYLTNYEIITNIVDFNEILQFIYIISNKFNNTHNINMFFTLYDKISFSTYKWLEIQKYIIQNIILYQLFNIMNSDNKYIYNLQYINNIYSNTFIYNLNIINPKFNELLHKYLHNVITKTNTSDNEHIILEQQTKHTILHTISSSLFNNQIFNILIQNNIHHKFINFINYNDDIPLIKFLQNINFIKLNNIKYTLSIIKHLSNKNIILTKNKNPLYTFITYSVLHNYNINTIALNKTIAVIKALTDIEDKVLIDNIYLDKYPIIVYYINNLFTQFNNTQFIQNIYNNNINTIAKNNLNYHTKIINSLIDKKKTILTQKFEFNQTVLHLAIIQNFPEFKILINKNKSNLLLTDDNSYTPLHYFIINHKYQYINNYYFNLLIDNKKYILNIMDNYNNNFLNFYLLNSECIKLSIIKFFKYKGNNVLLQNNNDNLLPIFTYLTKKNICYNILQELIDTNKSVIYKYCDNINYLFNNSLQFYLTNCDNIDINIISLLTNNYDENIINYKNNLNQTSLHIYIDRFFNKIHNNNSKKYIFILQKLINQNTIQITNHHEYYPLQLYLLKLQYNNNFHNNIHNYNIIKSLIDTNNHILSYQHNIQKSPLCIFLKYASNHIKDNISILKLLSNNSDKTLLSIYYNNILPIHLYIQNTNKVYKNTIELLLCQSFNNISSITNEDIKNILKNKKIY